MVLAFDVYLYGRSRVNFIHCYFNLRSLRLTVESRDLLLGGHKRLAYRFWGRLEH